MNTAAATSTRPTIVTSEMSVGRMLATGVAAFLVSQVLAVVVHGVLLSDDYAPFQGFLLRGAVSWQMLFLPVVHLLIIGSQVWLFARLRLAGSTLRRGLTIGAVGWTMSEAPTWLLWYAQQPWPGMLVAKQMVLELVSSLIVGLTIAVVAAHRGSR